MSAHFRLAFALPLAALALAGCVAQGEFPSLALRPEEREVSRAEPVRAPVNVADDPAVSASIAELRAQAASGERAFEEAFAPADRATARAGAPQSEAWIEAQQAISRLEAARGAVTTALASLDRLATARVDMPTSSADYAAIEAAVAALQEIAAGQQRRLDGLRARLPG